MSYKQIKRCLDIMVAGIALLVLSPFLLITAILIKLDSKGPVVFKQDRLGLHGVPFKIYKFRSMCVGAEQQGTGVYSFKGDKRITRIGQLIRATSIDELPQLVNILKGEMSLIGPRPTLTYHPWPYEQYTERQKHMLDFRPGVTGWAQVIGRKEVPWSERIELNIEYVDRMSLLFDLKIFVITVFKVFMMVDNNNITNTNK